MNRIMIVIIISLVHCIQVSGQATCIVLTDIDSQPITQVNALAVEDNGTIWMAADEGLFTSRDGVWQTESSPFDLPVNCMVVAPGGAIWASTHRGFLARYNGATWTTYEPSPAVIITFDVVDEKNVWCCTDQGVTHFDGESWETFGTEHGLCHTYLTCIEVTPGGEVWCSYGEPYLSEAHPEIMGCYGVSTYNGETWTTYTVEEGLFSDKVDDIAIDADGNVYLSFIGFGISRFDGTLWTTVTGQGHGELLFDRDGTLWAVCTLLCGPMRYSGGEWTYYCDIPIGQHSLNGCVACDMNNRIWIGSDNGLMYFDIMTGIASDEIRHPVVLQLQNVPNPFNNATTIFYAIPEPGPVELAVYTISGQHVTTLVESYRTAGTHQAVFNGAGLASGIYLYRAETPTSIGTGRMVLMK